MPLTDGLTMLQLDRLAALLNADADVQDLLPAGVAVKVYPPTAVSEEEGWAVSVHAGDVDHPPANKGDMGHEPRVVLVVMRHEAADAEAAAVRASYRDAVNLTDALKGILFSRYARDPQSPGLWHKLSFQQFSPVTTILRDPQGCHKTLTQFTLTAHRRF